MFNLAPTGFAGAVQGINLSPQLIWVGPIGAQVNPQGLNVQPILLYIGARRPLFWRERERERGRWRPGRARLEEKNPGRPAFFIHRPLPLALSLSPLLAGPIGVNVQPQGAKNNKKTGGGKALAERAHFFFFFPHSHLFSPSLPVVHRAPQVPISKPPIPTSRPLASLSSPR
jgi:hypothetical protein